MWVPLHHPVLTFQLQRHASETYVVHDYGQNTHRCYMFPRAKGTSSRAQILKHLRSPGINSKELILPAYVAWRAGRYDNPIPTRFLAPIVCYICNSSTVLKNELKNVIYFGGDVWTTAGWILNFPLKYILPPRCQNLGRIRKRAKCTGA
jgi:hypothetical protein